MVMNGMLTKKAGLEITSVLDRVVDFIKMSVIFNSCSYALEHRSSNTGYPSGMRDVVNSLSYKAYESVGYGLVAMYDHGHDLHCPNGHLVFAGVLVIMCHDVCEYVRDCYEENYVTSCMIMHGLNEDGFLAGCAVLFPVWNSLDCFEDGTARLFRHSLSTSMAGNLLVPRYSGKERLMEYLSGEWSANVKATALDVVKQMTGMSFSWPENVAMEAVSEAMCEDYRRMTVDALYESTSGQIADMCVEWTNGIINSPILREKTVRYVKRTSTAERGT